MNAVIYSRVSTDEQASKEHNLETQQGKSQALCERKGMTVLKVFTDAQSGRSADKRVAFQQMMTYCRQNRRDVKAVVVSDLSRLARSVADQGECIATLAGMGIRLYSVDEPHINETAAGKLAANIHGAFNQYFSDALSERTKERMQAAVKAGRFPWKGPLGYTNGRNGSSNLLLDPERAPLIRKAFELMATGNHGPDAVRHMVCTLGLRTKAGSPVPKQTFSRILRNELYAGWVVSGAVRAKGAHEPVVSQHLFDKVQDVLSGKRSVPHKAQNDDFPLRGFVKCSKCGKPLTAGWSRGRSQRYARFWCWTKGCAAVGVRRDDLEEQFLHLLSLMQPTQELIDSLPEIARRHWKTRQERVATERGQLTVRLNEQATLHRKAVEAFLNGKLSEADFEAVKAATSEETQRVRDFLNALESEQQTMESLIEQARREVVELAKTWREADALRKREVQWSLFPDGLLYSQNLGYFAPGNHSIIQDLKDFSNDPSLVGVPDGI